MAAEPASAVAPPTPITEGALAKAPEADRVSVGAPSVDTLRSAVIAALANGGCASAAELLNTAAWIIEGSHLRAEIPGVGRKMVSLTVNAAAEKIIRQELQRMGGPVKFSAVPGSGSAPASAAAPVIAAGSIQETALAHPIVQRAREIFHAEVRSVVDLREKS